MNYFLGHGYGRKFSDPKDNRIYRIRSGQAFWEELTGDPDFYLKLVNLMRDYATDHRKEFEKEWGIALDRFQYEFVSNFGNPDYSIDWEKLLCYNSGKDKVSWVSKVIPVTTNPAQKLYHTRRRAGDTLHVGIGNNLIRIPARKRHIP